MWRQTSGWVTCAKPSRRNPDPSVSHFLISLPFLHDFDVKSVILRFKVRKNGQQKACNLFCNIVTKRVAKRCSASYNPHQTCLATNQVVNRFERRWQNAQHRSSTRFAAMLPNKLHVFCCPFYRIFMDNENKQRRNFNSLYVNLDMVPWNLTSGGRSSFTESAIWSIRSNLVIGHLKYATAVF